MSQTSTPPNAKPPAHQMSNAMHGQACLFVSPPCLINPLEVVNGEIERERREERRRRRRRSHTEAQQAAAWAWPPLSVCLPPRNGNENVPSHSEVVLFPAGLPSTVRRLSV